MDPLFWILAGVVVGCVIGIVILWRLEVQAERKLAAQRQAEREASAKLPVVDPRLVIEGMDTRPIPAAQPLPAQKAAIQQSSQAPAGGMPQDQAPANGTHSPEPATPPEAPALAAAGKRGTPSSLPQELLQTTPERAALRATELACERQLLEQMIEERQARLDHLLHSRNPGDAEEAATISLLQSELAQRRERLQEASFLEHWYRQIANPWVEQQGEGFKSATPPNTPRAFGIRRHSLARVEPPGQNQPAPDVQVPSESSS
jgi:hypothetical protein